MSVKETILNKIQILISNHFKTPEEAFSFFDHDKDGDGFVNWEEFKPAIDEIKI